MNTALTATFAAAFFVGSAFFASRFMLKSVSAHQTSSSLSSASQGFASTEEFIKDLDAKKEEIDSVNKQAEQEIEQLCGYIREGNLTSDTAGLGYRASSRVSRSYKLAENLYNIAQDAKSKAESGADTAGDFCKYLSDSIYELSTTMEKFLSRCNMLLDSACSEG